MGYRLNLKWQQAFIFASNCADMAFRRVAPMNFHWINSKWFFEESKICQEVMLVECIILFRKVYNWLPNTAALPALATLINANLLD